MEKATARAVEYSPFARYIAAAKRLLDKAPCDRCRAAAAAIADGAGHGWCQPCADAVQVERRDGFERLEEARTALAAAKARRCSS